MRSFTIGLGLFLVAFAPAAMAQFSNEHTLEPPTPPGPSTGEQDADAYMANNGYRLDSNLTKYGSVSGYSPSSLSISLNPGQWAIAVINANGSNCSLAATYRETGYTVGTEDFSAQDAGGFQYIPLNVQSSMSGIAVTIKDASFRQGDRFEACGFEIRFYRFGDSGQYQPPPMDNPQANPCRACETWDEQQQRCRPWRACY